MNIWHVQHRLLTEQFEGFLHCDMAEITDDDVARLVCAAYVLARQHGVDKRGRCRHCYSRSRWWWLRRRKMCTVYQVFAVAMGQPFDILWAWIQDC